MINPIVEKIRSFFKQDDYTTVGDVRSFLFDLALELQKNTLLDGGGTRLVAPLSRFCVNVEVPAFWNSVTGKYDGFGTTTSVFFIDGKVFTSKIYAIKYLRTIDNLGLKEAKDFIDSLQAIPRKVDVS